MRTPIETHRLLTRLTDWAEVNDRTIKGFDAENVARGIPLGTGNAAYIVAQAKDYHETLLKKAAGEPEDAAGYRAHARSEAGRILALLLRECLRHNWDFLDVLHEGVEYEDEVVRTRTAASAKYLQNPEQG